MSNSVLQIRIDNELKNNAQEVFNNIGIDLSTAIRIFLNKSIISNGLPFDINNSSYIIDKDIKREIIDNSYLDKYINKEKSTYDDLSVEEYISDSRSKR